MCIFPSDGTNRIRFTGQSCSSISAGSPAPRRLCFVIKNIIPEKSDLSTHFTGKLPAAQNMEMQVLHALAAVLTAVGDHPEALFQTFGSGDLGDH